MFVVRSPQPPDGLGRDVDARADRHVVDDDREIGELGGDARVPVEQPRLLRPRVVGRDDERAARAEPLRLRGQLERLVEARAAGAREERHAAVDRRRDGAHHRDPLGDRLRGRLAGRAADRDAVRAVLELPVDEPATRVEVERAVGGERRDQRRDRAADRVRVGGEAAHAMLRGSPVPGLVLAPARVRERVDAAHRLAGLDALERPGLARLLRERVGGDLLGERRRGPRGRRRRRRRCTSPGITSAPPQAIGTLVSSGKWRRPSTAGCGAW